MYKRFWFAAIGVAVAGVSVFWSILQWSNKNSFLTFELPLLLAFIATVLALVPIVMLAARVDAAKIERDAIVLAASKRKGLISSVAKVAKRLTSLDVGRVQGAALSSVLELGFDKAELWMLRSEGQLELARQTSDSTGDGGSAREVFEMALDEGGVIQHDQLSAMVIDTDGVPAGILIAYGRAEICNDPLIMECLGLLAAHTSAGIDIARSAAERRSMQKRLAHWAFHDALTELPNRVLFGDRLELSLARTKRDGSKVAVLFMDLDGFKAINDELGHGDGDALLKAVSTRIASCLRPSDTLARYGGDEFVALIEKLESPLAAIAVAKRILKALEEPIEIGDVKLKTSTSIGVALTDARPGADVDVLRRADVAMYRAKSLGGAGYYVASDVIDLTDDAKREQNSTDDEKLFD